MVQYVKLLNNEWSIVETRSLRRAELNLHSAKFSAEKTYSKDTEIVLQLPTCQQAFSGLTSKDMWLAFIWQSTDIGSWLLRSILSVGIF
jgi:hypothetical protein